MRYTVDVVRFSVAERQMAILTTEKKQRNDCGQTLKNRHFGHIFV